MHPLNRHHQGDGRGEQEPDGPAGEDHGQAQELRPHPGGAGGDGARGDGEAHQEGAG